MSTPWPVLLSWVIVSGGLWETIHNHWKVGIFMVAFGFLLMLTWIARMLYAR